MKIILKKTSRILFFMSLGFGLYGQNNASDAQKFSYSNVVEFLQMHTGLASDAFEEKSFKLQNNAMISGMRVSGLYLSTKPDIDDKIYEFFIRTDNVEAAGPYLVYYVAGCKVKKAGGLTSFIIKGAECLCKVADDSNIILKARDVKSVFK